MVPPSAHLPTDAWTPREAEAEEVGWEWAAGQLWGLRLAVLVEERLEGHLWVIGMNCPLGLTREHELSTHPYEALKSRCRYRNLPRTR